MQKLPSNTLSGGGPVRRPNRVEVWFADLPKVLQALDVRVLVELDLTWERFASCSAKILATSSSLPALSSFNALSRAGARADHQRQSMDIRQTERSTAAEQMVYGFLMESLVGRAGSFLGVLPFPSPSNRRTLGRQRYASRSENGRTDPG